MEMANSADKAKLGDETYAVLLQDDENMRAGINALLDQISDNRVKVKQLHAEYSVTFGEVVSFKNRLDEMAEHYDDLIAQLHARRDELCKQIEKVTGSNSKL